MFPLGVTLELMLKMSSPQDVKEEKKSIPDRRIEQWGAGTGRGELRDIRYKAITGT